MEESRADPSPLNSSKPQNMEYTEAGSQTSHTLGATFSLVDAGTDNNLGLGQAVWNKEPHNTQLQGNLQMVSAILGQVGNE